MVTGPASTELPSPSSLLPSPPRPPPPESPTEDLENDHQQPPTCQPPSFTSIPPLLEDLDDHQHPQQPLNTNSLPVSSPQSSLAPPENVDDHQQPPSPPPAEVDDGRQPLASPSNSLSSPPQSSHRPPPISPSPTGPEEPVDKSNPEHVSELRRSLPSLEEPEDQLENPNYSSNHKFPLRQQQPSPSPSPSTSGPADPVENPSYSHNAISDRESPSSLPSPSATTPRQDLDESPSPKAEPSLSGSSAPPTVGSPSSPQETLETNTYQIQAIQPTGLPLPKTTISSSPKKPLPSPWTHQETANLIQAYQEKWYSLKKGQLKASQWEEVAITVAARCGYDEPTKSAKQCRHKIEKLRKRYRAERAKPRSRANAWNFFKLMDNMERGPLPISSSQPMELIEYPKPSSSSDKKRKVGDSDNEFHLNKKSSRLNRYNYLGGGGATGNLQGYVDGSDRVTRGLRTRVVQKRKVSYQEDDGEEEEYNYDNEHEEEEEEEEIDGVAEKLAAEIKSFAEMFVKVENKKLEMMRDTERYRREMESKRMEMILESQQRLVETINMAFSSHKKQKLPAN